MTKQPRYVCVHGHFYQPPRENPWLEAIEVQRSAHPYRDWNARITDECYRPNAASRILDERGRIERIVNNYASISFDVGPTLMSWLETEAPDVHAAIVEADRESRQRFGGHGSAMAQSYNHVIMPLANRRDKVTQTVWGIRDFEKRFGRKPEGMWLPETAVDTESLEVLAEHGILFTVLAPHQARRVAPLAEATLETDAETIDETELVTGEGEQAGRAPDWTDVNADTIDVGRAYRCELPSGRQIDLFFYDGGAARAVAFEGILSNGARFAERLMAIGPGLAHIATDGESYGHHHRHGDMALAYAMQRISRDPHVKLTNYGEFLATHPPEMRVEIHEATAWSCAHGVGRWKRDCGCHSGGHPGWNQRWRKPLRDALDWARDAMAELFEERGGKLFEDPWAARDDYIDVVLDRSERTIETFFERHAPGLAAEEMRKALELLEMQRHAMLMYTSCGWFFDELSGIETVQIMQYAARALELAQRHTASSIEAEFVDRLARARSNLDEHGDGRRIWQTMVKPARVDLRDVVAHWAVHAVIDETPERESARVYAYQIDVQELTRTRTGKARLAAGVVCAEAVTTRERETFCFAALHMGEHHLTGGVRRYPGESEYRTMVGHVHEAFEQAELVATQRELDRHFLDRSFSLKSLFRDHHDRVLAQILEGPLREAEGALRRLYEHNAALIHYLASGDVGLPEVLETAAQYVLDLRIRRALSTPEVDLEAVRSAMAEARRSRVKLDEARLSLVWQEAIEKLAARVSAHAEETALMDRLATLAKLAAEAQLSVNLWRAQNEVWELIDSARPAHKARLQAGDAEAERWLTSFTGLCDALMLRV